MRSAPRRPRLSRVVCVPLLALLTAVSPLSTPGASAAAGDSFADLQDFAVRCGPSGGSVALTASITDSASDLAVGCRLTIDLAGHDLTLNSILVAPSMSLTLTDSTSATGAPGLVTVGRSITAYGSLTIGGSARVDATGSANRAALGGAGSAAASSIVIEGDATVTARGGAAGVGIGDGPVTIRGRAAVTATGGSDSAGIGSSTNTVTKAITIGEDARVTATGGAGGPGIGAGAGSAWNGQGITIKDRATVGAVGGTGGAGVGGGSGVAGTAISIGAGATVTATAGPAQSGAAGAGVGAGAGAAGGAISIAGTLSATSPFSAVGAGSLTGGAGNTSFGSVTVTSGGILRLPSGNTAVPDSSGVELTVENGGRITGSGGSSPTYGTITGTGQVQNDGVIDLPTANISVPVTRRNYRLDLDANGGSVSPSSVTVFADTVANGNRTLPTPTRPGFAFGGWNTTAAGTGTTVTAATDLTAILAPSTGTATPQSLYAQWTRLTSVGTFADLAGLTTGCDPGAATLDVQLTAPISAPTQALAMTCPIKLDLAGNDLTVAALSSALFAEFTDSTAAPALPGTLTTTTGMSFGDALQFRGRIKVDATGVPGKAGIDSLGTAFYDQSQVRAIGGSGAPGLSGGVNFFHDSRGVAIGGAGAAGIGSGPGTRSTAIAILDRAVVEATGGSGGAGIGAGQGANQFGLVMIGGSATVTARAGDGAAGVGGGAGGSGALVSVGGSARLVAIGGGGATPGAGIGGGSGGSGPRLSLTGSAEVTATSSASAIGAGVAGSGAPGAFGSVTMAAGTTLRLPSGPLVIPDSNASGPEVTVATGAIITGSADALPTYATILGTGQIQNDGRILMPALNVGSSVTVSHRNYVLTYDARGGTATPSGATVFADTISNGGRVLPTPSKPGAVFAGWNTTADGSGSSVTESTDLTGLFGGTASGATARTLYAQWTPLTSVSTGDDLAGALSSCSDAVSPVRITVTAPISAPTTQVSVNCNAVLDLQGNTVTVQNVAIGQGKTFELTDSTPVADRASAGKLTTQSASSALANVAGIQARAATFIASGTVSVEAVGGSNAAGIDSSAVGPAAGTAIIQGYATVVAKGGSSGAGIGSATGALGGRVEIHGRASVSATGGTQAAGIGGGLRGSGGTVVIDGDAIVVAAGGFSGAGIGGGVSGSAAVVSVGGAAQVTATGGNLGAGIGLGSSGNLTAPASLEVTGTASITATGGDSGAGIGGGLLGSAIGVSVGAGASVVAIAGKAAAAIGSGAVADRGAGATVTIAGTVTASAKENGGSSALGAGISSSSVGFGSVTVKSGGVLRLPDGPLVIPNTNTSAPEITVESGGLITGSADATPTYATVTGTGQIQNDGVIDLPTANVSVPVTRRNYKLSFFAQFGTDPAPVTVFADSAANGRRTLPQPTAPGFTFQGWNTQALGFGRTVTDTTDLTTFLVPSSGTATPLTLYAQWKPLAEVGTAADLKGLLPSCDAFEVGQSNPVRMRLSASISMPDDLLYFGCWGVLDLAGHTITAKGLVVTPGAIAEITDSTPVSARASAGSLVIPGAPAGKAGVSLLTSARFTVSGTATVIATGGQGGAGIGGDAANTAGRITIKDDAVVTATGGLDGPGIGTGATTDFLSGTLSQVTVSDRAQVTAIGQGGGAGIGGGRGGPGVALTIGAGATVVATGGADAAGVGTGANPLTAFQNATATSISGTLTASGGVTALGRTGAAGSNGSVSVLSGGVLRLPAGPMLVPDTDTSGPEITVAAGGTITGSADSAPTYATITGTGQIQNDGAITLPTANVSVPVTRRHYRLNLDARGGSVSSSSVTVFADTLANGDRTLPTPTRRGSTFMGWNTKADGTGTTVVDTTDLTALLDPATGTPSVGTLYARWQVGDMTRDVDALIAGLGDCAGTTGTTTVKLAADLSDPASELAVACDVVLDLDGHTLTLRDIALASGTTLEVTDSSASGGGRLVVDTSALTGVPGVSTTGATLKVTGRAVLDARGGSQAAAVGGRIVGGVPLSGGTVVVEGTLIARGATSAAALGGPSSGSGFGTTTVRAGGLLRVTSGSVFLTDGGAGAELTVADGGVVDGSTDTTPTYARITGTGQIENGGRILLPLRNVGVAVTKRNYQIDYDPNQTNSSPLSGPRVYATTVQAGNRTLPTVTRPGYSFRSWNTAADGTGTTVTDTTDLRTLGDDATGDPTTITIYAQWQLGDPTTDIDAFAGAVSDCSAWAPADPIVLAADLVAPTLIVPVLCPVTVDLNGHRLTLQTLYLRHSGLVTFTDTSSPPAAPGVLTVPSGINTDGGSVLFTGAVHAVSRGSSTANTGGIARIEGRSGTTTITIDGHADVDVTGSGFYPAIGGVRAEVDIVIGGDATVRAVGAPGLMPTLPSTPGIGMQGARPSDPRSLLTVRDRAQVTAIGGPDAAGIGGGAGAGMDVAVLAGATVTAIGNGGAAGIGGGVSLDATRPDGGNVVIAGTVTAIGGVTAVGAGTARAPGTGTPQFGSLTVKSGGVLRLPSGPMLVPDTDAGGPEVVVETGGLITGSTDATPTYATITGDGQIENRGRLLLPTANVGTPVTQRHYRLEFDLAGAAGTTPSPITVFADSVTNGGRSFPADPSRPGFTFAGWNTKADGSGAAVTATSDLTTVLASATGPATTATLYAQWTPLTSVSSIAAVTDLLGGCTTTSPPLRVTLTANASDTAAELDVACDVVLDLDGHDLTVRNVVIGSGRTFEITDSTAVADRANAGTFTADSSSLPNGAGIRTTGATLRVTGTASVKATSSDSGVSGAAIGGAKEEDGGTVVVLDHASVMAVGAGGGAGIGGGWGRGAGGTVTIGDDATVVASGAKGGAAIGTGFTDTTGQPGPIVTIRDRAVVTASADNLGGAAIGGGAGNNGGTVVISGSAQVTATSLLGSGVGSGQHRHQTTPGGTLTLSGTLTAGGGLSALGVSLAYEPGDFGSVTVKSGGLLRIPTGTLFVPDADTSGPEVVVETGGVITQRVSPGPYLGLLAGSGQIRNDGRLLFPADQVSVAVTRRHYRLDFDLSGASGRTPSSVTTFADTVTNGERSMPADPTRDGFTFEGWNTAADGSGTDVDATTDLTTVLSAATGSASAVTLHAQWSPLDSVTTADELIGLADGCTGATTVSLAASIMTPGDLAVACDLTIDLAGFSLVTGAVEVEASGDLTLTDTTADPASAGQVTAQRGIRLSGADLTITGTAQVSATGAGGAGIGDGTTGVAHGAIVIEGRSRVEAYGDGPIGVGIGTSGGATGTPGSITIRGSAQVTAIGDRGAAGIAGTTTIGSGSTVTATGGASGLGVDSQGGAIAIAGTLTASGGASALGGLAADFGSVTVGSGGVLRLPSGGLAVPDTDATGPEIVVEAGGVIRGSTAASPSYASISGDGQIRNGGRILMPLSNVPVKVLDRHYQVDFSLNGAPGTPPSGVRVFADSFTAGGRTFPAAPTRSGYSFEGWNTRRDGAGSAVTASADLTAIGGAASGPPVGITAYAQWKLGDATRDVDAFVAALADCTNTTPPLVITLAADLSLPTRELVSSCNVVVDLNGHDVSVRDVVVKPGTTFEVTDSSTAPTAPGVLTVDASGTPGLPGITNGGADLVVSGRATVSVVGGSGASAIGDPTNGLGTVTVKDGATLELPSGQLVVPDSNGSKPEIVVEKGGTITGGASIVGPTTGTSGQISNAGVIDLPAANVQVPVSGGAFVVSFDLSGGSSNGGTTPPAAITVFAGSVAGGGASFPADPTRDGFVFTGWAVVVGGVLTPVTASTDLSVFGSADGSPVPVVLIAQWQPIPTGGGGGGGGGTPTPTPSPTPSPTSSPTPSPTALPAATVVLSAPVTVGAPVSASVSLASPVDGLAVAWRWSRVVDGVATPIEGATTGSYTPVAGDVGVVLRATADLTAPGYVSGSASADTAPVTAAGLPAVRVVLSGKPRVGKVLRGVLAGAPSANELSGLTVTWTWQRLSRRGTVRTVPGLPGLPGMRALTRADRGKRLRVTAVVAAPGYVPVTVTTVSGVVGKGRIPRPRVRLVRDGVVLVARVAGLRALAGKVPGLAVSYRWRDAAGHGIGDGRRLVIPPGYAGRIRVLVRLRAPGYVLRVVTRSMVVRRG